MKLSLVSPSAIKGRHAEYATIETPFGPALLAVSKGEICWLTFPQTGDGVEALRQWWRGGTLSPASDGLHAIAKAVFSEKAQNLTLFLPGTPFQHKVWQALANMKQGTTISYGALAAMIGNPGAARATGGAVGANPIVYLIPCHRILASNGSLHGFGCGLPMKTKLLQAEGFKAAA